MLTVKLGSDLFCDIDEALTQYGEYMCGIIVACDTNVCITVYTRALKIDSVRRVTSLVNKEEFTTHYPLVPVHKDLEKVPVMNLTVQPILDAYRLFVSMSLPICHIRDSIDKLREFMNEQELTTKVNDIVSLPSEVTLTEDHPEITALSELFILLPIMADKVANSVYCAATTYYDTPYVTTYEHMCVTSEVDITVTNRSCFIKHLGPLTVPICNYLSELDMSQTLITGRIVYSTNRVPTYSQYTNDSSGLPLLRQAMKGPLSHFSCTIDSNLRKLTINVDIHSFDFYFIPCLPMEMFVEDDVEVTANSHYTVIKKWWPNAIMTAEDGTWTVESPVFKDYTSGFRNVIIKQGNRHSCVKQWSVHDRVWYDGTGVYITKEASSHSSHYTFPDTDIDVLELCKFMESWLENRSHKPPQSLAQFLKDIPAFSDREMVVPPQRVPDSVYSMKLLDNYAITCTKYKRSYYWIIDGPLRGLVFKLPGILLGFAETPTSRLVDASQGQIHQFNYYVNKR